MKKDNKGFSLVELIIVIAIMAILVGIVGSQVLPYLNKSREAKDQQILSGWVTGALSAYSSNAAVCVDTEYIITIPVDNTGKVSADATVASQDTTKHGETELQNSFNELTACKGVSFSSTLYKKIDGDVKINVTPTNKDNDGLVVKVSALGNVPLGSIATSELVAK